MLMSTVPIANPSMYVLQKLYAYYTYCTLKATDLGKHISVLFEVTQCIQGLHQGTPPLIERNTNCGFPLRADRTNVQYMRGLLYLRLSNYPENVSSCVAFYWKTNSKRQENKLSCFQGVWQQGNSGKELNLRSGSSTFLHFTVGTFL